MKNLIPYILMLILLPSFASSQTFEEYKKESRKSLDKEAEEFKTYKKNLEEEFNSYVKELNKAYADYKKEVGEYWKNPKLSTQKSWVNYTKDKKTRTTVAFDKNTIVLETIATSEKDAQNRLKKALAKVVLEDTKKAIKDDVLQQRIAKIERKNAKLTVNKPIDSEPILAPIVFKKPPTKKRVVKYINKKIEKKKIIVKPSKIHNAKIYSVVVKLPSDTMIKRSKTFEEKVRKNAKRFDLPVALVFAIMHTESSFNPFAKSHIPAYGLMQIVPRSAGVDSYQFLYKKKKMPTAQYLYNSANNIEMGSAYLHILYYRYLKKINNPTSRLYCTIAAYNTGAGNIAYAFTKTHNINSAAKKIIAMKSQDVYNHLLKNLKYDEAKNYLKRVSQRVISYKKVYKSNDLIYFKGKAS